MKSMILEGEEGQSARGVSRSGTIKGRGMLITEQPKGPKSTFVKKEGKDRASSFEENQKRNLPRLKGRLREDGRHVLGKKVEPVALGRTKGR